MKRIFTRWALPCLLITSLHAQNVRNENGFTVIGPIEPVYVGPLQPVDGNGDQAFLEKEMQDKREFSPPTYFPKNYIHYPDAALQTNYVTNRTPSFNLLFNTDGFTYNGSFPPDPTSACGDLHFVVAVNGGSGCQYHVYNKTTGASLSANLGFPTPLSGGSYGDPVVVYDDMADRWVLCEISDVGSFNRINVYVSQTNNILTTGWNKYQVTVTSNDYPKLSAWPSGYFLTVNDGGPSVYALDRTQMLAGGATTVIQKTAADLSGFGFQALAAVDFDGDNPPPANAPCVILRHRDTEAHGPGSLPAVDYLEVFEFGPNFVTPGSSTWTSSPTQIPVSEFSSDLNGLFAFNCFPQPGTSQKLDPLREVIMNRPQYINFGTHQSIVCAQVTDVNGSDRGGIRWYEIRKPASTWTLYQEGTYAPAGDSYSRWMPAISQDINQNIAICYSISGSSSVYPGLRMTARSASDPLGQMTLTETTIVSGLSSQTGIERWGDYFAMTQDPVDWKAFYFDGMYMASGGNWRIRNYAFNFTTNALDMNMYTVSEFTTPQCNSTTRNVDAIIKNAGSTVITSCGVSYSLNGGAVTTIPYTGSLVSGAYDTIPLTLSPIVSGTNTLEIYVSSPNGGVDEDFGNDTLTYTFQASFGLSGSATQLQDILCNNANNGQLSITASSGLTPYTYSIGGSYVGTSTFTGIGAGTVTCSIKDAAGCVYTIAPTITFTNPPAITSSGSVVNASSGGATDGSITVTASGGTGSLQYNLNGGTYQGSNVFNGLGAGSYTVGVQDANGCTSTFVISVGALGVDVNPLTNALKVFPNPTFGKFSINYISAFVAEDATIEIFDGNGKAVKSMVAGDVYNGQNIEIDLTGNARDIYMLRFTSGKWSTEYKIILQ